VRAVKYDVHPSVAMIQKWTAELPAKTGRTLQQWADLVNSLVSKVRKDLIAYLKEKHGLGTNTANHIVAYATDSHSWDGDPTVYLQQAVKYVDGMFGSGKAELRPIFEKVQTAARKLGKDVKICPCKTIVPFYRNRVFAQVKPATKTRLELALALENVPYNGFLMRNPRANEKDRLQHVITLMTLADLTEEVLGWLKTAYDQDAGR
jgi:Domain of unknown function (DUF5655)/Domain of unknown function (DUF4287)